MQYRITRGTSALLVVDIQEKLLPAIHEKERVVENAVRLVRGAQALGVPIWVTEQYRKGLGATVPEVAQAAGCKVAGGIVPIDKITFSACGAPGLLKQISGRGVRDVVLCGIEAHVCVCQSALDLAAAGYRPVLVADATSSRTPENHRAGVERMRQAGAILASTEMILFEWLERSGTPEFKQILDLVK
jgi:nicotinamidase-related amidase